MLCDYGYSWTFSALMVSFVGYVLIRYLDIDILSVICMLPSVNVAFVCYHL